MSASDAAEFAGYLFSCWVAGFAVGYVISLFRKFFEHV